MRELGLGADDVIGVVVQRDIVERYPDRGGALLYAWRGGVELHVAVDLSLPGVTLVTTVYAVDRGRFPDGRTRRRSP